VRLRVLDVDNDGLVDLVGQFADGTLDVYVNTSTPGNPQFGIQKQIGVGWNGLARVIVADADNDGKEDLIGQWPNGVLTVYLNGGTPAAGTASRASSSTEPSQTSR
jgi:hypothetical protein